MITIINFAHPITDVQRAQIAALLGASPEELDIRTVRVQIDFERPLADQVRSLVDAIDIDWQGARYALRLPGLTDAAAVILADVHGRSGYWPSIVQFRAVPGTTPPTFEAHAVIDLQRVRNAAREERR